MSRARQRRRLLAARREDQRAVELTTWRQYPPISNALHMLACREPLAAPRYPVVRPMGKRWRDDA